MKKLKKRARRLLLWLTSGYDTRLALQDGIN